MQIEQPFRCPEQFLWELLNEPPRQCELAWEVSDIVGTRFTKTLSELETPPHIKRWKTAWEPRDPDRIIALYVSDRRHRSPRFRKLS